MIIASGDCIYKMDYNKILEYHIEKKADITVVCRDMDENAALERYGTIRMNEESRIEEFEEKPEVVAGPRPFPVAFISSEGASL